MDVNETLRLIRLTIKQMSVERKGSPKWVAHAAELVEYNEALDEWLVNGGFLPTAWLPGSMPVRGFVPDYAAGDIDYTPWVLGAPDIRQLSDEALGAQWEAFAATNPEFLENTDVIDDFYNWLNEHGYATFTMYGREWEVPTDLGTLEPGV